MASSILQMLIVSSLALMSEAAASPRVVSMPMAQKRNSTGALYKRDPFAISMQNFIPYGEYFVTASIGTPAQEIELIVDTGSSDIWMFGAGSCTRGSPCEGGQFNIERSSSASIVPGGQGAFSIQYQTPGSGVKGDYFTDVIAVGGVSVRNQTMAVATRAAQVPSGIMGIGLSVNEASVSQGLGQYPNFPDLLSSQGKIASRAYSLYLDDIATSSGRILFGGYDYNKFRGDLTMLPIQRDDQSNDFTSFTVSWTSLGINTPKNDYTLAQSDFVYGAVLDTGTTLTYLPSDIYQPIADYFNAQPSSQNVVLVDCNIGKENPGQLVYGLGGEDGAQIAVDFDELAVPIFSNRNGQQLTLQNGQPACQFGLSDAGESFSILFGQTFLRSAYVLYDLDNMQIGVAQTVFDSSTSNIMEYTNTTTSNRIQTDDGNPSVTYQATAAGSAVPGGGGYGSSFAYSDFGSVTGGFGQATDMVSVVPTQYDLPSFRYPSNNLPTAFPTVLPAGPTGRIGPGGGGDGSQAGAGAARGGGAGATGGSGGNSNEAGFTRPAFATAGVLMLAVLSTMLML